MNPLSLWRYRRELSEDVPLERIRYEIIYVASFAPILSLAVAINKT